MNGRRMGNMIGIGDLGDDLGSGVEAMLTEASGWESEDLGSSPVMMRRAGISGWNVIEDS